MAGLDLYVNGTKNYIKSLPKGKLYTYLLIIVMIIGGSVIGLSFIQRESYSLLFSGLSVEDASMIVSRLKDQKIPYRLEAGGTAIYVPKDKVYDVRLSLASQNALPGGGGVGFELFDKTSYGMTEFIQNINYRRAIQGELQRTINQMPEIKASRVHIALPERSLFLEKEKEATASVFLKMKPGRSLSREQVLGIVHLVAGSVEGLKPENVVVVDAQGKVLYKGGERDNPAFLSAQQFEMQKNIEKRIEESLQSMLDKFLNVGKSIVRVSVDLNLRKVEKVEEEYQPDKHAIINEKKTKEKSSNRYGSVGGVPGVKSNLQRKDEQINRENERVQTSEREESEASYEVSKSVRKIVEPYGDIKRISVAVVVDGKYEVTKTKKGEEIKYIPRTDKEIEDIRRLVARAIGFNEERGDKIEVINMPFETESFAEEKAQMEKEEKREMIFTLAKYGFYIAIAFAILFFVVRPILGLLKGSRHQGKETYISLGEREDNVQKELQPGSHSMSIAEGKQKFISDKVTDKEVVRAVIKEWIRENA
ncbi:MAG: flagellar basal-body MS-ring/collar protein FliF [Deltaproteobacteria bacterium]|nr:flagellar basal-body MS-ring/collar protein FliF [Deltaproteobacteria bacterium]